ncbi:MAG: sulfatase [Bradyrhizobium sp.]|uniref:sulfatase family protein n=1 Tax=Bradyrhizobium sp. TaxID=376 RepID=UPI000CA26BB6|nr:arylsulfatase [uncultured bacterium]
MKPNFVFILADDLGFADLGCYGGRAQVSPRLDAMAAQGVRFTRAYANSSVCSPTRFALMTGRYQYRLRGGAEEPLTGRWKGDKVVGLPPGHPTLPSLLRQGGYATALVGKWHLGYPPHFGPQLSGYEEHWGIHAGGCDYFTHADIAGKPCLFHNGEPTQAQGYLTDLLSERAARYVTDRGRDGKPFLLSLHYTAPHWPWQTRADAPAAGAPVQHLMHLDGGSIHTYRQMIREMDEGIGRVLDALDAAGLSDNTLVVFTSDNGGERFSDNWPLVGGKMDLTEGGIRVPCIARWRGVVEPGRVCETHNLTMDWTATMVTAAGLAADPAHPFDGLSLLSCLHGGSNTGERALYWRMTNKRQRAMRLGRWKYLAIGAYEYLFDVEADERERANQAKREPDRLAAMRAKFAAWDATMPPVPAEARVEAVYTEADMPGV